MSVIELAGRKVEITSPLPSASLNRQEIVSAYWSARWVLQRQADDKSAASEVKADWRFLQLSEDPFWWTTTRPMPNISEAIADPEHTSFVERGGIKLGVVMSPEHQTPLWVDPLARAYDREVAALPTKYNIEDPRVKEMIEQKQFLASLLRGYSAPVEAALVPGSGIWNRTAERIAHTYHEEAADLGFDTQLPARQAQERDMHQALIRMHGNILVLPLKPIKS